MVLNERSGFDPGRVKTLEAVVTAQETNRIKFLPRRPEEWFSRGKTQSGHGSSSCGDSISTSDDMVSEPGGVVSHSRQERRVHFG